MKVLRSLFCTILFVFLIFGIVDSNAQCSDQCTNSDPFCPNFSCCVSTQSNPFTFGKKVPIAINQDIGDFNCHQFVKAYIYSDQSGPQVLDCDSQPECPCIKYDDGNFAVEKEFVQVQYGYQANAIYYPCDHSAVRIGTFQYLSKDGHGGHLYAHGPTEYAANNNLCYPYTFWTYLGKIAPDVSGTTIDQTQVLSVRNKSSISYEWCATPAGMVSIQGSNSHQVTVTPIGNGPVEIRVTTSGYNNSEKTQCMSFDVASGEQCGDLYISGTVSFGTYSTYLSSYNSIFANTSYVGLTNSSVHHYEWTKTSGNANYNISFNGKNATLYMQTGQFLDFEVKAFNSSNNCLGSRDVYFQCSTTGGLYTQSNDIPSQNDNSSNLVNQQFEGSQIQIQESEKIINQTQIYPNPAFDLLTISNYKNNIKAITFYNLQGQLVLSRKFENSVKQYQADVSLLSSGIYYVNTTDETGQKNLRKVIIK